MLPRMAPARRAREAAVGRVACPRPCRLPKVKDFIPCKLCQSTAPPLVGTWSEECPDPAHLGLNKSLPSQAGLP